MDKNIFLIDDDPNILTLYGTALENEGFKVTTESSAINVINVLTKNKFDLIILDIIMPNIDGLSLLSQIKVNPSSKDTPIIVLSNYGQDELIQQSRSLGVKDYLLKYQCTLEKLVETVNNTLKANH